MNHRGCEMVRMDPFLDPSITTQIESF